MFSEISKKIITRLPYAKPFLFVDKITYIDENKIIGEFFFNKNLFFYEWHFIKKPITPATVQIEVMGQIGGVAFGIYLLNLHNNNKPFDVYAISVESDHLKIIPPDTKVIVEGYRIFLKANHLKTRCFMKNEDDEIFSASTILTRFEINE